MRGKSLKIFALLLCLSARAEADQRLISLPLWTLSPSEGFSNHAVAKHDQIAQFRMLPAQMIVLDEDFFQDNGRIAASKGTELIQVSDKLVACTIFPPKLSTGASVFAFGADRHLCFYDENSDGKFEKYYFRQAAESGFYNLIESIKNDFKVGNGGRYHSADPATMHKSLIWHLNLRWCRSAIEPAVLQDCTAEMALGVEGFDGVSAGAYSVIFKHDYDINLLKDRNKVDFFGNIFLFSSRDLNTINVSFSPNSAQKPFILQ